MVAQSAALCLPLSQGLIRHGRPSAHCRRFSADGGGLDVYPDRGGGGNRCRQLHRQPAVRLVDGQHHARQGPRLDSLQVQASTEGAALPEIAGRVRIAGQVIWATKFKEVATTTTQRSSGGKGGGGGGGSVTSTTYYYFANFAVGLCEGPIR